jgi:hypothetical protein
LQTQIAVEGLHFPADGRQRGCRVAAGTDVQYGIGGIILRQREVDQRLRRLADGLIIGVSGQGDHLREFVVAEEPHPFPNGILAGPVVGGGRLVHDRYARGVAGIERAEIAAGQQRYSERSEVSGADEAGRGEATTAALPSREQHGSGQGDPEWRVFCQGGSSHSGNRRRTLQRALLEAPAAVFGVAPVREVKGNDAQALRHESEVDARSVP